MNEPVPIRVIQITDTHLWADRQAQLLGVNTHKSLHAVLDFIRHTEKSIDLFMLTGDLSQDGSADSYRHLTEAFHAFQRPYHWVMGNHDHADVMQRVFQEEGVCTDRQVLVGDWQFILLNSQKVNAVEGYLAPSQLDFLKQCLEMYPTRFSTVVFHHQPISVNAAWLTPLGLANADAFWSILKQYPSVKLVLFGHVHQEMNQMVHGIACHSAPSTCFQFKPDASRFRLDHLPPGYRWLDLYPNGSIKTGIVRLAQYIGQFEEEACGY